MSFLSPENQAALADRLQQMDNSEPTETTQEVVEVQETQETQAETAPSEEATGTERDVNVAEDSSTSDENSIPYSRFKSVIESRNEFKSKVSDLERQLEELRVAQENKTTEESTEEDDLFGYLDNEDDYEDPRYSELEKRLEKFEMYQAEVDLQKEISTTKQAFPNVPEEVLLNAVIHDADADLMEIAHKYDMFVDNIRKEALKGYDPAASQPVETPSAPRRVSPAGAAGATFDASVNKPKNMDDAKASFMDYLRLNWK